MKGTWGGHKKKTFEGVLINDIPLYTIWCGIKSRCYNQNAANYKYYGANRKKHSELNDEQRKKANCRSYANVYKKKGKLKREPCVVCKGLVTEFHHEDYSKPLEVKNLCRECHLSLHRNTEKIALLNDTDIFGTDYYIPKK